MRNAVCLALVQDECRAILILFDGDDDCPKELAPTVEAWARDEAGPVPCVVVLAHREYEAWFIAAIESLRGRRGVLADAASHPDPEAPRDAKGRLEHRMKSGLSYAETADQAGADRVIRHVGGLCTVQVVQANGQSIRTVGDRYWD